MAREHIRGGLQLGGLLIQFDTTVHSLHVFTRQLITCSLQLHSDGRSPEMMSQNEASATAKAAAAMKMCWHEMGRLE